MINFISNELNPVTVLSSEPYARPCRDPRRRRRRHASAVGDPRSPRGRVLSLLEATLPLSSPGSVSVSPSPSSSPSGSRRASRAELAAGAAPANPHRPRFDYAHPELRSLALCLFHSFPSSAAPKPGRIGPCAARGRHCWPPSSAPPSSLTSRPFSVRLDAVVSFPMSYSISLTSSPLSLCATTAENTSCRRGCRVAVAHSWPASL